MKNVSSFYSSLNSSIAFLMFLPCYCKNKQYKSLSINWQSKSELQYIPADKSIMDFASNEVFLYLYAT